MAAFDFQHQVGRRFTGESVQRLIAFLDRSEITPDLDADIIARIGFGFPVAGAAKRVDPMPWTGKPLRSSDIMTRSELNDRFSCDAEGAMNEIDPVTGSIKTRLKHSLQSIRAMSRKQSGEPAGS